MSNDWVIVDHRGANECTECMRVKGGWLYRTRVRDNYRNESVAMAFVPDTDEKKDAANVR